MAMKIRQRGWSVVRVEGLSMIPTLAPDERALVHWGAEVGLGDVVVAQRMDRPELLLVKRLVRSAGTGWWLEGDNPAASDDSRAFGAVETDAVIGKVVARWSGWKLVRL